MNRTLASLVNVAAGVGYLAMAGLAAAQDPVLASPSIYRILFENESIRVLSVVIGPGERDELHSHPRYLIFVQDPGILRVYPNDGEPVELALERGQIEMLEPVERHWGENVGTTVVRLTAIEFKP